MNAGPIRIATRASRLALWQAGHVADLIRAAAPGRAVELVHVSTTGDRDTQSSLPQFGGVGVFTREIQTAVLDGRADLTVHSLKDLPTESVSGLTLVAVPNRGPTSDVLVLAKSLEPKAEVQDLPQAARVGTGSLRRRAQLLHLRGDVVLLDVRGNVETRLRKLDDGEYDALILAEAGLDRLGLRDRVAVLLNPPDFFPAVGQGAIGIECRTGDADLRALLAGINHRPTWVAIQCERALLHALRAGCHAPLGVATHLAGEQLTLEAVVLSADGRQRLHAAHTGAAQRAEQLGRDVAVLLNRQGAERLLAPVE